MREIKFRGKSLVTDEWVYGGYYNQDDCLKGRRMHIIVYDSTKPGVQTKHERVDPETLGQYTGLKDKNGKEIYKGDIIASTMNNQIKMVIKFGEYDSYCPADDEYMRNVGFYAEAEDYPQMPLGPTEEYAILLGNIYENPELLEVK